MRGRNGHNANDYTELTTAFITLTGGVSYAKLPMV